ncbi:hypothetical protein CDCA_CDCA03G0986 [Cyanidium caldarium]|uniref:Uncharacterized protein n=1 Tax=Cyanidium caldarium TaxID=2771 RepID=A0AAV9IS94_CYACA|nr:hypothetical protein CDCA_CDCA03G0986 [Cyanidium caldarium]
MAYFMRLLDLTRRVDGSTEPVRAAEAFGIARPRMEWLCRADEGGGSGGSGVNCARIDRYVVHACGTHTETVLHLVPRSRWPSEEGETPVWPPPFGEYEALLLVCRPTCIDSDAMLGRWQADYPAMCIGDRVLLERDLPERWEGCVGDALVQAVALIVLDGDGSGDSIVDDVENPPYIHPAVIAALRQTYNSVRHFLTNLPSLDRAVDAGQVRTHRAVFASELDALHMVDEEGAPAAVPVSARHTITELLAVPTSLAAPQTRRGYLIIALAPMRGMDAVPSSVYFRESRKRPDG